MQFIKIPLRLGGLFSRRMHASGGAARERHAQPHAGAETQRRFGDPNIHYLDGRVLYGDEDHARLPLPDGLHPDGATHALMGERFAAAAFGEGRPFA
ncbi:hypothetical protein ACL58G_17015 [Massilia sp. GER05]|uniref:hypothetical protein n=1 Tax=unclassified Massilia TaxID=2609279 RepID=UPI0039AF23CE